MRATLRPPTPHPLLSARRPRHATAAAASRAPPPPEWDRVAVVLVDHGSKRAAANAALDEFAEVYRSVSGRPVVEVAHMELASPTLSDAVAACKAAGAARVVVAPYFLSRGRHVDTDIPALAAAAAAESGLPVDVAAPLGVDAALAGVVEARVRDSVGG